MIFFKKILRKNFEWIASKLTDQKRKVKADTHLKKKKKIKIFNFKKTKKKQVSKGTVRNFRNLPIQSYK
jgi:hypothetical protein